MLKPEEAYQALAARTAPEGMIVDGDLNYSQEATRTATPRPVPSHFPKGLTVNLFDVSGSNAELPEDLNAYELDASGTNLTRLPQGISVKSRLDLTGCEQLESLPEGLKVGSLVLRNCTGLVALPEGLDVWFLDVTGCWALEQWPERANIRCGQLSLQGCPEVRELPKNLGSLSGLNVRECSNLMRLPDDLIVTGWLELAYSGLTKEEMLPPTLVKTQLRWAGVDIDRRIAFYPERIKIKEILNERNTERRRVLIDRYGYGRFIKDAKAKRLNRDTDPGGQRELLRVKLKDDEDLVALSCFCPSTGRQYMIRVPPGTKTCHQAAAWIAGFDNPSDYQPLVET